MPVGGRTREALYSTTMWRIGLVILFTLSFALGFASANKGGERAVPSPVPLAAPAAPAALPQPQAASAPALPQPIAPVTMPSSAVEQFRVFADGLRADRPVVLWDALPAPQQLEVNSLLASCATQLDAESWSQTFGALGELGAVLTQRPELVRGSALAMSLLAMSSEDRSAEAWFRLGPVLTQLARSPLGDAEKLATLDVAKRLDAEGRTLSAALPDLSRAMRGSLDELIAGRDRLEATRAIELEQEGERTLLRLESPGQPVEDTWFVKRENRWVPESLDQAWPQRITGARERCAELARNGKFAGWLQTLAASRPALAQLARAQTQPDFDSGMGAVAESVGPQLAQMLLDSMLESASIGGLKLNIGSMLYKGPSSSAPPQPAP